jgi:hypothetical protein
MGTVGSQSEALLSWHRQSHTHPIFNPDYAKENLVSLAETLAMLYLYFAIFTLTLHYFVVSGLIETQTIPWMIIEASTRNLLNRIPAELVTNKFSIALAIITTIVAAKLTRNSFEIVKASLHPEDEFKKQAITMTVTEIPAVPKTVKAKPLKRSGTNIEPRNTWK